MAIPIRTLQVVDRRLGPLACAALQPLRLARRLRRRPAAPVRRILLIKFWGLGSLQLLTPAVRALRRRHPGAEIHLLTLRQNSRFARRLGAFDRVLPLDVSADTWSAVARRIAGCVRAVRRRRYDAVYDFEFFTRFSALVSVLTGAPTTRGFSAPRVRRGGFHTETVPFNRYWHVARNFRCLAGGETGGDVVAGDLLRFRVRRADELEAAAAAFEEGLGPGGPLVVLNPNAGSLSLERRWPPDRFAELARRLAREDGARIALVGAAGERSFTAAVAARSGLGQGELANLAGRLSVGGLAALLARADAFVSNDSGPMHLGAALGTPTIGLFGPETPVMYRPLGQRASFLHEPPPCSPCINVHENKLAVCWRGRAECMTNLDVDLVLARVRDELERGRAPLPLPSPRAG